MLSTRLSSSLTANASPSIQQILSEQVNKSKFAEWKEPAVERPTTADSNSVASFALSPVHSPVSSPITVSSAFTFNTTANSTVNSKLDDELEERLQHLDTVGRIRSRRESARLKYQQILINRSCPRPQSSPAAVTSSKIISRSKLKKPDRIQRDCSEIDERDDSNGGMSFEGRETDIDDYFSRQSAASTVASLQMRPTSAVTVNNYFRQYGDIGLESSYQVKPRPHIKRYAEEYNTLVEKVVDLVSKRKSETSKDHDAIIRSGQLNKVATMVVGIGFETYVELKMGSFRYYEDVGNSNVKIRTIPLHKHSTKCRATKHMETQPFAGWSRVFELIMEGSGRRLFWMAKSEDERNKWIQDINNAMVETRHDQIDLSDLNSPTYNADIVLYLHTQGLIRGATDFDDYQSAISLLSDKRLSIPVNWLKQYSGINKSRSEPDEMDLWKQLLKRSITINGQVIKRASYDRAVSALSSHIMDMDNCTTQFNSSRTKIKDSQAILYARDILLLCCQETMEDDNHSLFCVDALFGSNLASVYPSPSDADPLKINVRRINLSGDKIIGIESIGNGSQDIKSTDSLFGDSDARSLDLSSCAEESVQGSVMNDPNLNVEVSVKMSNIYRICMKSHFSNTDGETCG